MKKETPQYPVGSTFLDKRSGGTFVKINDTDWVCEQLKLELSDAFLNRQLKKKLSRFSDLNTTDLVEVKEKPTIDWDLIGKLFREANLKIMSERGYGMLSDETTEWFKLTLNREDN